MSNHSQQRPNIMVIHCHDIGRHLGCYGRGVETPNIDSLADEGVRFDQYFSTAPYCAPSRCSRMTGLYPVNHGAIGQTHLGWKMNDGVQTLPMYMNALGYDTHLFGFQHEAIDPRDLGYQHTEYGFPNATISAMDVAPRVQQFLDSYREENGPFYMDVGFTEAHSMTPRGGFENWPDNLPVPRFKPKYVHRVDAPKYEGQIVRPVDNPCDPYFRDYDPDEVQPLPYLPDRRGIREDIADLNSLITCVIDVAVGRILDKLSATGLDKNTLVIFTTDHGIEVPRAKGSLYDAGIECALIMRYPDNFQPGTTNDALLSNVDFLPTLVETAGGNAPDDIDGHSFLPMLQNRPYQRRDHIYAENTWHGQYIPIRGIRTERFKYLMNFDTHKHLLYPQNRSAREVLTELLNGFKGIEELYDLESDPHEQNNLASTRKMFGFGDVDFTGLSGWEPCHPDYKRIATSFKAQLRAHMEETDDLLLNGPVTHPGFEHIWDDL